ncbi:unnamed protein product [Leuciscus chuanchicus]
MFVRLALGHKRATPPSILHVTQKRIFSENVLSHALARFLPSLSSDGRSARLDVNAVISLYDTRELPLPSVLFITQNLLRDSDTTARFSCLESTTLKLFSLTARTSRHSKDSESLRTETEHTLIFSITSLSL